MLKRLTEFRRENIRNIGKIIEGICALYKLLSRDACYINVRNPRDFVLTLNMFLRY